MCKRYVILFSISLVIIIVLQTIILYKYHTISSKYDFVNKKYQQLANIPILKYKEDFSDRILDIELPKSVEMEVPTTVMNLIITPERYINKNVNVVGFLAKATTCRGNIVYELYMYKEDDELPDIKRSIFIDTENIDDLLKRNLEDCSNDYVAIWGRFTFEKCNGPLCFSGGTLKPYGVNRYTKMRKHPDK